MTLDEIAIWYALVLGVGVSAGIFLSGRLTDRFAARAPQVFGLLPGLALALAVPFFIAFVHAPTWPVALAFLTVPTFLNYFYLTPAVTRSEERRVGKAGGSTGRSRGSPYH